MLKYIPHKNNKHNWRTYLFIFFVMAISTTAVYFILTFPNSIQEDTTASEINNVQQVQEQEPVAVSAPVQTSTPEPLVMPVAVIEVAKAAPPPANRNKNPLTRLEEAKLYTQPQILTGKYIDISLNYQNMVIFEDGKALDAYQVSSGKRGLDTPVGRFKIENKSPRAWSKKYGLWMPNWMAFLPSGEMGIHELPVWPGGYQEGANHLGTPVSHGCVRLGVGAAKRVYDWAEIGTPIIIHK